MLLDRTIDLAKAGADPAAAVKILLEYGPSVSSVREAQAELIGALARNPFVDLVGIQAGRILWALLDAIKLAESTPALARAA